MNSAQASLVLGHLRRLAGTRPGDQPADAHLLERFTAERDETAFAALVRRHGPMVLNVCRSVLRHEQDAEDAFQATFLVLARKAASLRQPAAVAGWLYEVAYHLALKAQADAARRRAQERRASPMPAADPTLDMTLRDLHRVLHEELRRLPEKYRLPLVLCYLEGRSQAEAADQLGWSKGTLRGRLDRGREHLRRRLAARGVTLSGLLWATAITPRATATALVNAVIRAVGSSAGEAGAVSARVAALAEGVTQAVFTSKLKFATAVLLAVGLVAGTGALARQAPTMREQAVGGPKSEARSLKPAPAAAQPSAADEKGDQAEVSGRVVDPDGRPFAGAKVFFARTVLAHRGRPGSPAPVVTTDAEGRFRLRISRTGYQTGNEYERSHWMRGAVVAVGQGFGHGWVGADQGETLANVTVKLAREVPISGRVVDLQGKPIVGVRVQVRRVRFREDGGDLKTMVEALQRTKTWPQGPSAPWWAWAEPALLGLTRPAVTDAEGRFRLGGLAGECVATLRFEGPTIEAAEVGALTRPAPTIRLPRSPDRPELGNVIYHGNTFDYAAAPTRPVTGIVRDRDTGQPLAGVIVRARLGSAKEHFVGDPYLEATTDAEGHYRLVGLSRNGRHPLEALPAHGQPYLPAVRTLAATGGLDPVTMDFPLKHGVLIRGRVTDKATGRPVPAVVCYGVFADNPHRKEAPGYRDVDSDLAEVRTGADGSFTLLGLPGPGLLAVKAADPEKVQCYAMGSGADAIQGPKFGDSFDTEPSGCDPGAFNTLVAINPARDAQAIVRDLVLDPGRTVTGTITDPDGKPVTGASIDSLRGGRFHLRDLPTADFRITGVDPKQSRWFIIRHPTRNLGALVFIRGDEPGPVTIRLQKCGTLTGRVVDDDGLPRSVFIFSVIETEQLKGEHSFGVGSSPLQRIGKDGRFRIEGVIPEHKTGVYVGKTPSYVDPVANGLTLKAGEVKDLGDMRVKPSE